MTRLPRRQALAILREISANTRAMISVWDWTPRLTKYGITDPSLERAQWKRLAEFATAIERGGRVLREMAERLEGPK